MKQAVVIHPRFTIYGGGEMVAMHVIKALQGLNYDVSIATANYNPADVEKNFQMGKVMESCNPIELPPFRPVLSKFLAVQLVRYASKVRDVLRNLRTDIAFGTQSIMYYVPGIRTFNIVYDMTGLFEIPAEGYAYGPLASIWKKPYYRILRRTHQAALRESGLLIPLSHALEQQLAALGYPHSSVVFPPCDMIFKPRLKKRQACLVSRIAPQKNIEDFMRVAKMIPDCRFALVGTHPEMNPAYARRVLSIKPPNVEYIIARIRDRPNIVEESKVYLYTSHEPGIGIALGQAMGAGCIPITPAWGGGAEMVSESGVGYTYRTIDDAVQSVRNALESVRQRDNPNHVAERARLFSSENFEGTIAKLTQLGDQANS